jgi:hypothetical protein
MATLVSDQNSRIAAPDPEGVYREDFLRALVPVGIDAREAAALGEAVIGREFPTCSAAELVPVLEQLLVLVQLRSKQPHARQTCRA